MTPGWVVAVAADAEHRFSKLVCNTIDLVAGGGVRGDAHAGATVQHRSRIARDPSQPNLRQVYLCHSELLDELALKGFTLNAGDIGENILTRGVDLLALPTGTRLRLGPSAIVIITGLRNPCAQLDHFRSGLMAAVLDRAADGSLVRKAGVMATVENSGTVRPDDAIIINRPPTPWAALVPV